jgi:hypothetical protein
MNTYVKQPGGYAAIVGGCPADRLVRQTNVGRGLIVKNKRNLLFKSLSPKVVSDQQASRVTQNDVLGNLLAVSRQTSLQSQLPSY